MPPDARPGKLDLELATVTPPPSSTVISLPDLPEDVFLLVVTNLSAWDVLSCQRVSKSWRAAFSSDDHVRFVLQSYPRAREVRALPPGTLHLHSSCQQQQTSLDWKALLAAVASRYHSLARGTARLVNRYPMAPVEQLGDWFPVGQWDYHESQPGGRLYYETAASHLSRIGTKPYLFRPTLWSYDDGLLVYAPAECNDDGYFPQILALLDVETGHKYAIPFDIRAKIVRNLRLKDRTLIVEWAEKDPFHNLNAMEQVNRHFANCFDVIQQQDKSWKVTWRSEWKMHFLGLPPNYHDRFFSTHNAIHYAVYFWQPNRSMYTGDEELPIESLSVWDISAPSSYRPSTDPSGKFRPPEKAGPYIVSRFSFTQMDLFGIRQRASVALMSLHLDSETLSLTVRENVGVAGQGYFDPAERLWCAKTTTFPFLGQGPRLFREWDGNLPPYRGHCSMETADVEESERWFLPVMDVVDAEAGVRLSLVETCFSGQSVENRLVVRLKVEAANDKDSVLHGDEEASAATGPVWATLDDDLTKEVSFMGRIAGDERWLIGQNERMELVVLKF
ncbi:uncharacterized protein Z519_12238 [Cladophialophora bantiana CBS 173.52]|uniref:F-box domain-containing protein n=1 Tax=Cladophialophora bantiana (strain ATCC 10958 / CBS 173.52 / CDC B-1940 / NIH 8579) TaxID=1442370 RepID=A0A0D2FKB0_CLAB1|nr:uncharacterized protein Z519_12238 [Cladophialophora bantiana CBS 173.52]KIW87127.1 hypothetical protein Z519_12238 [Cladophialophora bantiana CBS 173.52]